MDDLADIKQKLDHNVEALALYLFGEPTSRRGQQWRWGRNGSVTIGVSGRWRGRFRSWEADVGGSMLDAIQFANGCGLVEAIRWARAWLGDDRPALPPRPVVVDIDAEEIQRRDNARNLWAASGPIAGTPAEQYLHGRSITPGDNRGWPASVRWHRSSGAAIFASTAPDGTITAIQRVFLHQDGTPKLEDGSKIKRSLGPRYGGAVRFAGEQRALCLAEGPETALSVWYATGIETWAGLGAIGSIDLSPVPISRTIVVCRDDDAKNAPSRKAQREAIRRWRREGRTVLEALPHERTRRDKSDFNDALIEAGPDAVAARLNAALCELSEAGGELFPPIKNPKVSLPLSWSRKALADATHAAVGELWERRDEETTPVLALKVSLGLGKTHAALAEAIQWIETGKGPVVYAVPTHKLSDEIVRRANDAGGGRVRIAVWRGRETDDPEAQGEQMCRDLDAVDDVRRHGGDVQKQVCMDGARRCPFADACGYQRQRMQQADLWIVAHQVLFTQKPEAIPAPSLVIIDEGFAQAGLQGISGHRIMVSEHEIGAGPDVAGNIGKTADLDDVLVPIRRKLSTALAGHPDGPVSRSALIEAGLTRDDAIAARKAEWQRKVNLDVWPGMPAEQRRKALLAASGNVGITRMARLWSLVADLLAEDGPALSGCLTVEETTDEATAAKYRGIRLRWHDAIRDGWIAPLLHIDATIDPQLVRPYFPQLEMRADIQAETPHMRIVQYPDRAFSKASLAGNDKLIDKVWLWSLAKARAAGGRWLLVVQKAVEDSIRARHQIPEFMDLAHHNAIAGRDEWRDIAGLIVVGRTQPPPQAVQSIASALSGQHVDVATTPDGYYAAQIATIRAKDGNAVTVEVDHAGNPLAEAVRRSICEGEIEQIIGRARGVNRTADDPVEVHFLSNVPLSQPVDELAEWTPPSLDDQLFATHGVWLSSGGDMATVLNMHRAMVERARQRAEKQMVTVPYKSLFYGTVTIWKEAAYRRAGPRWSMQRVVYDPRAIPDIQAFLRSRLGDLAEFSEVQPEIEAEVEPVALYAGEFTEQYARAREAEVEPLAVYAGGIMPPDVADRVRRTLRATGWTQQRLASHVGISRPQLTNALQDRFGLSGDPAQRLMAFLAVPPAVVQPSLF